MFFENPEVSWLSKDINLEVENVSDSDDDKGARGILFGKLFDQLFLKWQLIFLILMTSFDLSNDL